MSAKGGSGIVKGQEVTVYRAVEHTKPRPFVSGRTYFALDPKYIDEQFRLGVEGGVPQFEFGTNVTKYTLKLRKVFDPSNAEHRSLLIEKLLRDDPSVSIDIAKLDKSLATGHWTLIEDIMEGFLENGRLVNKFVELGFDGTLIKERNFVNVVAFDAAQQARVGK